MLTINYILTVGLSIFIGIFIYYRIKESREDLRHRDGYEIADGLTVGNELENIQGLSEEQLIK